MVAQQTIAVNKQEVLMHAEHLVKEFPVHRGIVHAVSDVSFDIIKGRTLAIVGESGCGKSTLGRLLLRLIEPTSGSILFEGQDITKLDAENLRMLRRQMQMIFQDPYASLDPRMSVGKIIAEPMSTYAVGANSQERELMVRELMDKVGIRPEFYTRFPHQFSGGQRQRIGIARALALNPKLIVCDEPVSALDVSIQAQILNLLLELQDELLLTYVFISHDLRVVRFMSSRVCVMFLGRLCELCPTGELYDHPLHPYSKFLLSSVPKPDPRLRDHNRQILTGEVGSPLNPPSGCRFHLRCPNACARCKEEQPEMRDMGNGHFVACHCV